VATIPVDPGLVVLQEQRAALQVLGLWNGDSFRMAKPAVALAGIERSRLMTLAFRVLADAAVAAEAECQRILEAAEAQSAEIVKNAHDDVARLTDWLVASTRGPAVLPPAPEVTPADLAPSQEGEIGHDETVGAEFFASFASDSADRWRFLEDDVLVGPGPALVRRLLRRPNPSRPLLREGKGALP
jgi:hypothetical protein